ncbi:DnaJ- protein scj1 [Rhizophlyctis rosea]|nr:DnaJ- protein scj1 [Rhizophlyctis rosea]
MRLLSHFAFLALALLLLVDLVLAAKDYYKILKVDRSATKREIKKSYRELSKKVHPDRNPDDPKAEEKFAELAAAYEVLTDDEKRRIYDQYGEEGLKQQGGGGFRSPHDIFSQFGFGGFGHHHHHQEKKGPSIHMILDVTLEDLFKGDSIDIEINKQIICPTCRGSGAKRAEDVHTCNVCQGSGIKIVRQMLAPGMYQQMQATCDACGGRGKIVKSKCPACHGHKVMRGSRQLTVDVEKGMVDGQKIAFEGEADESPDATAGDVIFTLRTAPHPVFTRRGDNLYMKEHISLKEALLGFRHQVTQLDGSVVKIEREGVTQHGGLALFAFGDVGGCWLGVMPFSCILTFRV